MRLVAKWEKTFNMVNIRYVFYQAFNYEQIVNHLTNLPPVLIHVLRNLVSEVMITKGKKKVQDMKEINY